jgi:hypothetical protein
LIVHWNCAARHRLGQSDEHHVADLRLLAERRERSAHRVLVRAVERARLALGRQREHRLQLAGDDVDGFGGGEHDRFLRLAAQRRHPGALGDGERGLCGLGEPERDPGVRCGRREQLQTDELEELEVQPVGDPVQPVHQHVGHVGERLDQRDARVADVVVGPAGAAGHDHPLGVVDQLLEAAIVEVRCGECHQ